MEGSDARSRPFSRAARRWQSQVPTEQKRRVEYGKGRVPMILPKTHDVLVVEDDQELREAVGSILQEEGCSVRAASNGAEALTLLRGEARPCIILLDLMMPVMNGWQFLEQRKSDVQLEEIPVVVMSAYLDMPGFAAPHLPVEATLKKPLDLDRLLDSVNSHCNCQSK